jgi:VanZ family protein
MSIRDWWRAFFGAWLAFVTFQTLTPSPDQTTSGIALARWLAEALFHRPELADKIAHFLAYAVLGAAAAFAGFRILGLRSLVIALLAAYGASLEGMQGLGAVRAPELVDAAANALGIITAYPVADFLGRRFPRSAAA